MSIGFWITVIGCGLFLLSIIIQKILKWVFSADEVYPFLMWMFCIGMALLIIGLAIWYSNP